MPSFENFTDVRGHGEDAPQGGEFSRFDTCIFDLDDTLYPLSSGIAAACRINIFDYMVERLGFERETVAEFGRSLYVTHGTTMAGLRAIGYPFDFDDYHAFVHGRLPYHLLRPDPVLRNLLHSMPQRKFVFTNGDKVHAARCLKALGLEDCFDTVISFETIMAHPPVSQAPSIIKGAEVAREGEVEGEGLEEGVQASWVGPTGPLVCCKPQLEAYRRALAIARADPARAVFFDDSTRNIEAAKAAGLHTVLVGSSVRSAGADWAVASIHNVREAIPELWDAPSQMDTMAPEKSVAVEAVRA